MYINDTTKEQRTWKQLQTALPNLSLPPDKTPVIGTEWFYISKVTPPVFNEYTDKQVEVEPTKVGEIYSQTYTVYPLVGSEASKAFDRFLLTKISDIKQAARLERDAGFTSSALGTPHEYGSTLEDRINLIGANQGGQPTNYNAKEAGVRVRKVHTQAQMNKVLADGFTALQVINDKEATLLATVEAATTVADLTLISW